MARESHYSGVNISAVGERHENRDFPPSSRAAQLVHQFTSGNKRPNIQDHETFQQLLLEVLGTGVHQLGPAEAPENDVESNCKLVYVIVKAGLETWIPKNPFERDPGSNQQIQIIQDSLCAINITIDRCPEVLFVKYPFPESKSSRCIPLHQWLIPTLLAFLAKSDILEVQKGVESLLKSCILIEKRLRSKRFKHRPISLYIKSFVQDSLRYLETTFPVQTEHLSLPSSETLRELEDDIGQQSSIEQAPKMTITSRNQALNIATRLLVVVDEVDSADNRKSLSIRSHSNTNAWMLNTITQLWLILRHEGTLFDSKSAPHSCLQTIIKILRSYLMRCLKADLDLMGLSKSLLLLSQLLISILSAPYPSSVKSLEGLVSSSLMELAYAARVSDSSNRVVCEFLLPSLRQVVSDISRLQALDEDLQHAITLTISILNENTEQVTKYLEGNHIPPFQDIELLQKVQIFFCDLDIARDPAEDPAPRASKRLRVSRKPPGELQFGELPSWMTKICHTLSIEAELETENLENVITERYPNLSEDEQTQIFLCLGQSACRSADFQVHASYPRQAIDISSRDFVKCTVCDADKKDKALSSPNDANRPNAMISILSNLIMLPREQKSKKPRIAAMMALSRILSHTSEEKFLNLDRSTFGQWCLQALQSSVRELRIAAGRTLPVFLRASLGCSVYSKNRLLALDCLRKLSDQGDLALQETCIFAWGQIARSLDDGGEMNLVLLRLVEYLGHTNGLICSLAFDELQRICNHSPFSAMKIFAPYWRTIAVTVVQDLQHRPQVAQQISDLLAMSVVEFLVLTQVYTVPFFVLTKKQDILRRIADACGRSVMALCREHNNLAAILAGILLQSSDDAENLVMGLLNAVSPEFIHVDYAELLKSEPQATAAELLKSAGEDDGPKKSKAQQALRFLANVTQSRQLSGRASTTKMDLTGSFFENHVLGIMAILADTINDGKGPQPRLEKIICIGAVREMVSMARGHISNGLPQICACLRSAIGSRELPDEAFQAWIVVIQTLGEDDIANLVDPTFAIIVQHWDDFMPKTQRQAREMVNYLLSSHGSLIRDLSRTLPSLAGIPVMSKLDAEIENSKVQMDVKQHFQAFIQRLQNENTTVVTRAMTELTTYLEENQGWLHEATIAEQPDPVVSLLTRSILDTSISFNESDANITELCAKCLGFVGCLDSTKIEAGKEKKQILALSNFMRDEENRDFIIFFLREVLVKAFLSATNSRSQGFLAYAMQEMLRLGDFQSSVGPRSHNMPFDANSQRWHSLPESIRTVLTPFLNSKYFVTAGVAQPPSSYPLYSPEISHKQWLRVFCHDLLKRQVGYGMIQQLFPVLSRIIRSQDIAIPEFLLPFAVLNVMLNGTDKEKMDIANEMLAVIDQPLTDNAIMRENVILCSQSIFHVIDYLTRWMQEKKKELSRIRSPSSRARQPTEAEIERDTIQISSLELVLNMIPADVISRRAVECQSFSRALFHWEQYIRQEDQKHAATDHLVDREALFERLQDIYTQIDEPDGIEGISAHLQVLNIDQQILEHRKAGRWSAAQSWYEILLKDRPNDLEAQYNLLTCLKESGQHDSLLCHVQGFEPSNASKAISLPFAAEASWIRGDWAKLKECVEQYPKGDGDEFNIGVGRALLALVNHQTQDFATVLHDLRQNNMRGLSATNTSSLQACHDRMLKFHALTELDMINRTRNSSDLDKAGLMTILERRLDIIGPFLGDKEYVLGLRRAVMLLSDQYSNTDISSLWLRSAKLARKSGLTHQAFNAVLHASQLEDESAMIEHSRLLWRAGNHRKAIRSLEGAIATNAFGLHDHMTSDKSMNTGNPASTSNVLKAKAYLLLAKWVDRAGQTQSEAIIHQYKRATEAHPRWEKGHYYLGKHYNKLLESEKAKPPSKQAQTFITGETAKLVVENYLRSIAFGAKYIFQTLPKILTLWLDLGYESEQPVDSKYGNDEGFRSHVMSQRRKLLSACNSQVKKYTDRLPAWVFYTALPQVVARICHSNQAVYHALVDIVAKVVIQHTPQALWTLLAMVKSSSKDRANRGAACVARVLENARKEKKFVGNEMKTWITQGQKLSEQLLQVCEGDIQGKPNQISLSKDLGFIHKAAMCKLAVPFESEMTAALPATTESVIMRQHKAFNSADYVHISSFLDDVLVLNSLQKPRKISIRGSDGHVYAILCKPKDDLRKDQRLMEFNAMINRSLKKDAESSKRRLYIKTYAVTPLSEECGLIEWVDNLKTLRDILLASYKQKCIHINYQEIRQLLTESVSAPNMLPIFTDRIIPHFPPVFHEWFVEMFSESDAWFTARLRYTRSCAVMSIIGHVLGLGDRHGENILFEEGTGGTLHVDFNCLFDKGLTFEKPELVPFRLTHNMVDAFGAQGHEGPFRKSCELTLDILRSNEDTLMTILETFLYDPTTDFIGKKKKVNPIVPTTPEGVLENVRYKVHGLLEGESVPLSVEGYTDQLIKRARDPWNLASMYIGWCAFF